MRLRYALAGTLIVTDSLGLVVKAPVDHSRLW